METSTVRKRLEEACHELDKSIEVLRGEKPAVRAAAISRRTRPTPGPTSPRTTGPKRCSHSAVSQRTEILAALTRIQEGSYGNCADCGRPIPGGPAGGPPGGGPLRGLPVQA